MIILGIPLFGLGSEGRGLGQSTSSSGLREEQEGWVQRAEVISGPFRNMSVKKRIYKHSFLNEAPRMQIITCSDAQVKF